jgi:hypothetical protein
MIMGAVVGILMACVTASAQATVILDCAAPPYYLSFVLTLDHVAQTFSLHRDSSLLASGKVQELKTFELKWTNATAPTGNSLKIMTHVPPGLDITGQADGATGSLQVNGEKRDFVCYWNQ